VLVRETGQNKLTVYRKIDAETGETLLYCHSEQKAKKEQAIRNRFHVRLEEALDKLNAGLDKKGTIKNYAKILDRIGRLREKIAALHQATVSRSLPMLKKTTPSVLNGYVNPKVNKKISTAVFTA
jgi:hypothetical protein